MGPLTTNASSARDASQAQPRYDETPDQGCPTATQRVIRTLFGAAGGCEARIVALCAEPGMGRSEILTAAVSEAAARHMRVVRRSFACVSPETASRALARLARKTSPEESPLLVCLDEIPPSDELHVDRQARALRRLWLSGVSVVFSVLPEAHQLLEKIPECIEIPASCLLVHSFAEAEGHKPGRVVSRLSRGIFRLSRVLGEDEGSAPVAAFSAPEYYDALGELMAQSLRPTLSDEERRLRLAILLLGKGSRDDLFAVLGEAPDELLDVIRMSAPLFGVSRDLLRFNSLSAVARGALAACLRNLTPTCTLFPEVPASCLKVLSERGDFDRAATIASLPECASALSAVAGHGVEFLDAGEVALVLRATELGARPQSAETRRLGVVASVLSSSAPTVAASGDGMDFPSEDVLALFMDARRLLRGDLPLSRPGFKARDEIGSRLATHVGASLLMRRGAFSTALTMLVGTADEVEGDSVSGALLCVDRELARVMAGGRVRDVAETTRRAEELLRRRSLKGLGGYVTALRLVRALLSDDRGAPEELDGLAARHERASDSLVQVIALICGAVADLRGDAPIRARIRASLAETLASGVDLDYLKRVATCLERVALARSGEPVEPVSEAGEDDLDRVCTFVWQTMASEDDPLSPTPASGPIPWDALWLLRVLCTGMGSFSVALIEAMPPNWRRAAAANGALQPLRQRGRQAVAQVGPEGSGVKGRPVEIRLLGGFALLVHGVLVSDWKLERRNAKSMLEYLVLRGGSAKRYQLFDQIWPDSDYSMGISRAYQATSVLRGAIAEIDPELCLVTANRMSGEVVVDMGILSCDVNAFREAAREAVDGDDDARKLECARRAERLYAGDLYVPTVDSTGFITGLCSALRDLYADAMVEGSAAALRLGRERVAVRLAENATMANELREDANEALVRALRACGRPEEARRRLSSFEARAHRGARASRRGSAGSSSVSARAAS